MSHGFDRGGLQFAAPPLGGALRVAFAGPPERRAAALGGELADVEGRFFAPDAGAPIVAFEPHVVVCFDPQADLPWLDRLAAAKLAFCEGEAPPKRVSAQFDRLVTVDPGVDGAWRSLPLPVADSLFRDVEPVNGPPSALLVAPVTPHRDWMLEAARKAHRVVQIEAEPDLDALAALLAEHPVGLNLHARPGQGFHHRACVALAAGQLLLSEVLRPEHGLELAIDYVDVTTPYGLAHTLEVLRRYPGTWDSTRVRGRLKAEGFRASRVWPRLLGDLLADMAAFDGRAGHAA